MSKRNGWLYKFVRYEINFLTKEECIYVDGNLHEKRAIYGGFLGFFQSDLLLEFISQLGRQGWELQSELGSNESRNLTFKYSFVLEEEEVLTEKNIDNEEFNREFVMLNNELFIFRNKTVSALNKVEKILIKLQDQLELVSQEKLISPTGIDYRYLDNLLATGNWREADEETYRILLKASCVTGLKWLKEENIFQITKEDLLMINRLWMQHSNGHFSYSSQKRLLEDLSANLDINKHDSFFKEKFCAHVGWHRDGAYLKYHQLTYNLSAPEGHLPTVHVGWHKEGDWLRYLQFLSWKVF